jgi:uncharacterized protein YlxW (UPF0749 family)
MTMKTTVARRGLSLRTGRNLTLILAGLLLGLSLAVRWKGIAVPSADAPAARERAAQGIRELEQEQEQLKVTLAGLREGLAAAQKSAAQNTDQLTRLKSELEREQVAAGLVKLQGPGVLVTLDDSKMNNANAVNLDAAKDYIIHEYDLRDVVNLLWNAGAEAIAINDERLVNTTSIYCVGSTIMVNDTRLSPPYQVRAIGDRKSLEALLENSAYLANLRQRVKGFGLVFKVSWPATVEIPAFTGTFRVRYAHSEEVNP